MVVSHIGSLNMLIHHSGILEPPAVVVDKLDGGYGEVRGIVILQRAGEDGGEGGVHHALLLPAAARRVTGLESTE